MKPLSLKTTLAPSRLIMRDESRTISKVKPKIRIIHIVAPEIIKTDVENFRELVQRLTGKPVEAKRSRNSKGNSTTSSEILPTKPCGCNIPRTNTLESSVAMLQDTRRVKEEIIDEIHGEETIIPNGILKFLGDIDGFFQDMNEFRPFSLIRPSSQTNTYGEMPLTDVF